MSSEPRRKEQIIMIYITCVYEHKTETLM